MNPNAPSFGNQGSSHGNGNYQRPRNVFDDPIITAEDSSTPNHNRTIPEYFPRGPAVNGLRTSTSQYGSWTPFEGRQPIQDQRSQIFTGPQHTSPYLNPRPSQDFGLSSLQLNDRSGRHQNHMPQTPSHRSTKDHLASTQRSIDLNEAELKRLKSQDSLRDGDGKRLAEVEKQLKELKEINEKMKVTIKTQSQALSNPRTYQPSTGGYGGHPTPARAHTAPRPATQTPYQQYGPPPTFNMTPGLPSIPTGPRNQSRHGVPQGPPITRPNTIDPFGSPKPTPRPNVQPAAATRNPRASTSQALVLVGTHAEVHDFMLNTEALFDKSQRFAYSYANVPNRYNDERMPQTLRELIGTSTAPGFPYNLMNTPTTRYWMVSATINRYLVDNILKFEVFGEHDGSVTHAVKELKDQVYASKSSFLLDTLRCMLTCFSLATPPILRDSLFEQIYDNMHALYTSQAFKEWSGAFMRRHTSLLSAHIHPLMHIKNHNVSQDLHQLVYDAFHLAKELFYGHYVWRFRFPASNTPFDSRMMLNRDLMMPASDVSLMQRGIRIHVAISPIVLMRDRSKQKVESTVVAKAMVLMKPGQ